MQSALADIGRLAGGAVSPDPVPELVRKYRDAMRGYGSGTDEENAVYDTEVLTPAEEALAKAVPTTRQGVIAVLETVARRHRRPRDPDIAIDKQVILTALVKNALKAIKAGAGC